MLNLNPNKMKFFFKPYFFIIYLFSFSSNAQDIKQNEEYIDGRLVITQEQSDVVVSTSLKAIQRDDGKYYTFNINVGNSSDKTLIMKVNDFDAFITIKGKKDDKVKDLEILSNREYQEKKKKRGGLRAAIASMQANKNAEDAGTSYSSSQTNIKSNSYSNTNSETTGNARVSDAFDPTNAADISYNSNTNSSTSSNSNTQIESGSVSYDGAAAYAARQNEERKLREYMNQQAAAKQSWSDNYLKSETLEPLEVVSGLLNIKYIKGDLVTLIIKVGKLNFLFDWDPEESEF